MGIIGSIFTGIASANKAKAAANSQMIGAQSAQAEIGKGEQQSRDFLNNEYNSTVANQQPYLQAGQAGANHLASIINGPGFQAPTLDQARQTPGYEFQLEQGIGALDKSASATGNLYSGTQGTALEKYGQGLADSTYNNVYNQALQTYMTNYNTALGGAQLGEGAAGTLGQQGNQAAAINTGIDLGGAEAQAQQINNAAAARASGYVGQANAYGNMANQVGGDISGALMGNYENGTPWWAGV